MEEFNGLAATRTLKRPAPSSQQTMKQAKLTWSKPRGNRISITESELTGLVLNMVTESMLPFSLVERPSFKEFITVCQPGVAISSCYSIVKTLEKHEFSKAAVKNAMTSIEFVETTADCLTAHRCFYLGVTAHWWCYDNFERKSAALACRRLTGSHTYDLLADQLQDVYCEYGIKSKVIKTITDSGSNFAKAFSVFAPSEDDLDVCAIDASDILSTDLNSQLPPHHKCAAHFLNLICTTDAAVAEQSHHYKKVSRGTFAKCQALWNKSTRSVLAAEVVENESSLQLNVLVPRDGILRMMQRGA